MCKMIIIALIITPDYQISNVKVMFFSAAIELFFIIIKTFWKYNNPQITPITACFCSQIILEFCFHCENENCAFV